MTEKRYLCDCFFTNNIFVKSAKKHFNHRNLQQFEQDYSQYILKNSLDKKKIFSEIEVEKDRRIRNGYLSKWRKETIAKKYIPLHKDIYTLKDEHLTNDFKELCNYAKQGNKSADTLTKTKDPDIFLMKVFTDDFCKKFVAEMQHFEKCDLPKGRPNTMNKTGILLEELGFYDNCLDKLRINYLNPLINSLGWLDKAELDSQRAFVVSYHCNDNDGDMGLDRHYDNAEATLNVCMGEEFEGGELCFYGDAQGDQQEKLTCIDHIRGSAVLHFGRHVHSAMPVTSGNRYNLIMWLRASVVRNICCPMCGDVPRLIETPGDGDGFTWVARWWCDVL